MFSFGLNLITIWLTCFSLRPIIIFIYIFVAVIFHSVFLSHFSSFNARFRFHFSVLHVHQDIRNDEMLKVFQNVNRIYTKCHTNPGKWPENSMRASTRFVDTEFDSFSEYFTFHFVPCYVWNACHNYNQHIISCVIVSLECLQFMNQKLNIKS